MGKRMDRPPRMMIEELLDGDHLPEDVREAVRNDIADRKRAEKELRASEERFRLLADNATDVIWVRGLDLSLSYISPAVERLRGFTVEEARRYHAEGHFPPGSMGPKIEAAIDFLEGGGKRVIITQPHLLEDALHGRTGTHIVP